MGFFLLTWDLYIYFPSTVLVRQASAAAASIAPPAMSCAIDPFHMGNHTDAFCRETCHPELPHLAHRLEGIRTSVCEFTFTWLSAYRHKTKHMNRFGFLFFLQEMAWSHNDNIFGQHAPEVETGV